MSEVDTTLRTIADLIDNLENHPKKAGIIDFAEDKPVHLSYEDLLTNVKRLAQGLIDDGLRKGDRVIILAPNSPEWIMTCLAVIYAGGVAVPTDPQHLDEALAHIFEDSEARWFAADERGAERIRTLLPRRHLKMIRLDDRANERSVQSLLSRTQLKSSDLKEDDVAILFYTSGTTGVPKGVPLTNANIMMQMSAVVQKLDFISGKDRLLLPLPLFHVYPLNIGLFSCLTLGITLTIPRSITGPEMMRAMKDGKVTVLLAVPRLLRALYTGIEKKAHAKLGKLFDAMISACEFSERFLSLPLGKLVFKQVKRELAPTLRLFLSGGAPLDGDMTRKLKALGWDIAVGYGLTETAPLICIRMPDNQDVDSVGAPIPGVEVRIAKTENKENTEERTNPNEGEIQAKGKNIFTGYLNLDEQTAETFTEDGWFKTGDLGYMSGNNLHVTGRVATLMVLEGGKKFQPDHIEEKFAGEGPIKEFALLQKDHKLVALIVPNPKLSGKDDLRKAIETELSSKGSSLPSYMRISDFAMTNQPLPRTNLGKLKRHELKERFDQAKSEEKSGKKKSAGTMPIEEFSAEDRALMENQAANQAWEWLTKRFPDQYISPDTNIQLDLNVDSMEWMNLTMELLQQTGVELTQDAIGRITTVHDLLTEVNEASQSGERRKGSPVQKPEEYLGKKEKRWLSPLNKVEFALAHVLYFINFCLMHGLFRMHTSGLDKVPEGQVVFIPNHASYLDVFAITSILSVKRMKTTQTAGWAGIAFHDWFTAYLSRLSFAFPIEAEKSLLSSLAMGASVLKKGRSMIWFPEGERTLDGKLLKFKSGIGMILEGSNVPVIPVFLNGTRQALEPGKWFPHLKQDITVVFGEPVLSQQLLEEGEGDTPSSKIADALRKRVQALSRRTVIGEKAKAGDGHKGKAA
jgi:long-chain acyl-CoA synthetase